MFTLLHETAVLDRLRELPDNSVDAIVTDPPYGLGKEPDALAMLQDWMETGHHKVKSKSGFMGKEWDAFVPQPVQWRECLRVLKPGGHLLAFASTRTQDLMALGLRIAGFEIRDMISWLYGSGFPKSHNLEEEWEGFGTALKPAQEPITLARKPLDGTIEATVLKWHTGALNIDACRISTSDSLNGGRVSSTTEGWDRPWKHDANAIEAVMQRGAAQVAKAEDLGRWPANVIHDGSQQILDLFPVSLGQRGDLQGHNKERQSPNGCFGKMAPARDHAARVETDTSAARFFYCAKTSKSDRNEGCDHLPDKEWAAEGACVPERERRPFNPSKNNHPTVKPTALMRYLCRLITPPGGIILDPFLGSGSTGKAALLEGFRFIGIEKDPAYLAIAQARIENATKE